MGLVHVTELHRRVGCLLADLLLLLVLIVEFELFDQVPQSDAVVRVQLVRILLHALLGVVSDCAP